MIRRVLRWVPALRALNPLNPKNGWTRVRRRNFQLINIYEHEATNKMTHKSKEVVIKGDSKVDVDGGKIELN